MQNFPDPLAHGELINVVEGIYCVRGRFKMGPGIAIGRTMTVVDGGDGLVVLNAVRLSDRAQDELDAIGKVTHLIKLSDSHSVDESFYADRYKPTVWSLPGADMGKLSVDRTLGPEGPVSGGVVVDYGETRGWREGAYWVPMGGGTLVTCDSVQNCVDTEGASFGGRMIMSVMGFKGGVVVPPMWKRVHKLSGDGVSKTLAGLTDLSFANLVTAHGPPITGGADTMLRSAVERAST